MHAGRKRYRYRAKEREMIERIVRKRRPRKGRLVVSYRQIGRELNDEGCRTRTGKRWYSRMVRLICERQKLVTASEKEAGLSHKSDIGPGDYLCDEEIRRCQRPKTASYAAFLFDKFPKFRRGYRTPAKAAWA